MLSVLKQVLKEINYEQNMIMVVYFKNEYEK